MSATNTSTTFGARDHARAQAGERVASMRTVPASTAVGVPEDIPSDRLVLDETVAAGRYTAKALAVGTRVRFIDVEGDACVQLQLFNALAPHERLNVADTAKVQWQAYLGEGSLLLTDMGRVIGTIVEDTSERHDLFCGASHTGGGVGDPLPTARSLLTLGVARFGLDRRDVHPCVNLFKGVRSVDGDRLAFVGGSGAGRHVDVRIELPVYLVIANTPHVLDDRDPAVCTPVRVIGWKGQPVATDDRWRNATPEGLRAFENTEEFLLGHPLDAR